MRKIIPLLISGLILSCGKPDTKPKPTDLEVLSEKVGKLQLEQCSAGGVTWICQRVEDGDAALWHGLTCLGLKDVDICNQVSSFVEESGRPRRTPARRGTVEEDSYSRDMFLGFLAGSLQSRDVETFNKVMSYLQNNENKLCPKSSDSRCNLTFVTKVLAVKVGKAIGAGHQLMSQWSDGDLNIQLLAQSKVTRPGYESHIVGVELWLLKELNAFDAQGKAAAEQLHKKQPQNAFFAWLAGDKAAAANLAAGQAPEGRTVAHNRWTFNTKDDEQPWTGSIGWEFKVLLNLLER